MDPLDSKPKNSPLPLVFAGIFGVVLIGLGIFAGFSLTSSEKVDYNSFKPYLTEDENSSFDESKSFKELDSSSPSEENAAFEIPSNYGIDESASYRNYTSVDSEESLLTELSLGSIALLKETLSDYFSFAYPAFSSVKFSEAYFNPEAPLTLVSDSGKTFFVKLSAEKNEKTNFYKITNIELTSEKGKTLLSYDGRFFDFSVYDLEDERTLNGASDFEDIFNEGSADDSSSF